MRQENLVGVRVEKGELLYSVRGSINCCGHNENQSREFCKIEIALLYEHVI